MEVGCGLAVASSRDARHQENFLEPSALAVLPGEASRKAGASSGWVSASANYLDAPYDRFRPVSTSGRGTRFARRLDRFAAVHDIGGREPCYRSHDKFAVPGGY